MVWCGVVCVCVCCVVLCCVCMCVCVCERERERERESARARAYALILVSTDKTLRFINIIFTLMTLVLISLAVLYYERKTKVSLWREPRAISKPEQVRI